MKGFVFALCTKKMRRGFVRLAASAGQQSSRRRRRTIGILAHVDAGKTTTTEQVLFASGRRSRPGRVDTGSTATDFLPAERERGITIQSAAVHLSWRDTTIALIDTPGHVDFGHEVERALAALDGVVVVVDAVAGAQARTQVVARAAAKRRIPSLILINKMDRAGADFDKAIESVRRKCPFLPRLLPIHRPHFDQQKKFEGFADLVTEKSYDFEDCDAPHNDEEFFESVVEEACDVDDRLAEKYLEEGSSSVKAEDVRAALARATRTSQCSPVLCGAMLKGVGTRALLDAVVDYLPSPEEMGFGAVDESKPFRALAFKVSHDPHRGPLVFLRALEGSLTTAMTSKSLVLYNQASFKERPTGFLRPFADALEKVDEAIVPGDIFVAVGLKKTVSGQTVSTEKSPAPAPQFPKPGPPVFALAVEPDRSSDFGPLVDTLRLLERDDPSLRVDVDSGETAVLAGMGELHLQVARDRLRDEFKFRPRFGEPSVAYRETVLDDGDGVFGEGLFDKTPTVAATSLDDGKIPPSRMFCGVKLGVVHDPEHVDVQVVFEAPTENPELDQALTDGIEAASRSGPLEAHPLANLKVTVLRVDVDKDTTPGAARAAAAAALQDALKKAKKVVLEPILLLSVHMPHHHLGSVLQDVSKKRNTTIVQVKRPMDTTDEDDSSSKDENDEHQNDLLDYDDTHVVEATAPLSELLGFSTHLRSLTAGEAYFEAHYSHYAPRR